MSASSANRVRGLVGAGALALAFNSLAAGPVGIGESVGARLRYTSALLDAIVAAAQGDQLAAFTPGGFMHDLEAAAKTVGDKPVVVDFPPRANRELLRITGVVPPKAYAAQSIPVCAEQNNRVLGTWNITAEGRVMPVTGNWALTTDTHTACKDFILRSRETFNQMVAQGAPATPAIVMPPSAVAGPEITERTFAAAPSTPPVSQEEQQRQADCHTPPHPILNWCEGSTVYRSMLRRSMEEYSGDPVIRVLAEAFISKLEAKLRDRSESADMVDDGVTITDPKILSDPRRAGKPNYYHTVAVIPPRSARDQGLRVCFEGGADKTSRHVIAIHTIFPTGIVFSDPEATRQAAARASSCTNFVLATRDAMNHRMAEQQDTPPRLDCTEVMSKPRVVIPETPKLRELQLQQRACLKAQSAGR